MKPFALPLILCFCLGWGLQANAAPDVAPAAPPAKYVLPEGITEDMLAPPPVPRFMLETTSKPLTQEEMVRQAREAERKAAAAVKKSTPKP